jgi:3-phosphoshikimate 1-carboxyvinyltransferase
VIPPSKSHTIRALLIATLANGRSVIRHPLLEGDGYSALEAARGLGAGVTVSGHDVIVEGIGGDLEKGEEFIFVGNSGTSTRLFSAAAALGTRARTFDGDDSLRTRKMQPLLSALEQLGAGFWLHQAGRDIPFSVQGPLKGGRCQVYGLSSQFVSALLFACPLIKADSDITVTDLHEKPYVEMTLWWLDKMGIRYQASEDLAHFTIPGGQHYHPIDERIAGDFSGATFPAVAAVLCGGTLSLENIDFNDPQGDKKVFDLLAALGADVQRTAGGANVTGGRQFSGQSIDLNSMPDALPALAVLGCHAQGTTALHNVKQARIKETDRIAVMTRELTKMGAKVEELPDGIVMHHSQLRGAVVDGHGDHRVVMALALAAMIAEGETIIETAESAAVTYPTFAEDFRRLGAHIEVLPD